MQTLSVNKPLNFFLRKTQVSMFKVGLCERAIIMTKTTLRFREEILPRTLALRYGRALWPWPLHGPWSPLFSEPLTSASRLRPQIYHSVAQRTSSSVLSPKTLTFEFWINYYRLSTKLWEGNVFSPVCPSAILPTLGGGCDHYPWFIGPPCTGRPPLPDMFKLVHHEAGTVGKQRVHIPL